jgi:hypothetical protein
MTLLYSTGALQRWDVVDVDGPVFWGPTRSITSPVWCVRSSSVPPFRTHLNARLPVDLHIPGYQGRRSSSCTETRRQHHLPQNTPHERVRGSA